MQDLLRDWWEKKYFRVVAYVAFAFFSFVVFLLMTFPDHRVKEITANQIEEVLDHRYDVRINDMGFWRLTGVKMEGIRLEERGEDDGDGAIGSGLTVQLEELAGRFSPLRSLINRGPTASYRVDIGGGVVSGTAGQVGPNQEVTVSLNNLDLQDSTLIDSLLGVRLLGNLDGDIELTIDPTTGIATGGRVDVTGEQLTLGETVIRSDQIPILTELDLPTTSFGSLNLQMDIEETENGSRVEFERFDLRGRDVQMEVWGHIDLVPSGGRPDVEMRLQVSENYVTEHDLGAVFNMSEFREGEFETDEGYWYGFAISGHFDNLDFRGSSDAGRGPEAGGGDEEADGDGE